MKLELFLCLSMCACSAGPNDLTQTDDPPKKNPGDAMTQQDTGHADAALDGGSTSDAPMSQPDASDDGSADAGMDAPIVILDAGGCLSNNDCANSEFCNKSINDCKGLGQCKKTPQICPLTLIPVCGCDGATYDNDCIANSARESIAHNGKCP